MSFGAIGNGVADDTAAFNAAIAAANGGAVLVPNPSVSYRITSTINIPNNTFLVGETPKVTKILHAFNGNMFTMGSYAGLINLYVEGQGGSYSGKGITCLGTNGQQTFSGLKIIDFNDDCLYFDYLAGSQCFVENCIMSQTSGTTGSGNYAIAIQDTIANTAVPRAFDGIETNGYCSFYFGGSNDTFVSNSFLGDLNFSANSIGVHLANCRISNQSALTINGHDNTFVGCDFAPQITLASGCDTIMIQGCIFNILPIIDGSGNARNLYDTWEQIYTVSFTSGGTPPSIGNGTVFSAFCTTGCQTTIFGALTLGSTTSLGTGGLSISLPATRQTLDIFVGGTVLMSVSGTIYTGVLEIAGAVATATLLRDTTGSITYNSPATFGTGDYIRWSMTYVN